MGDNSFKISCLRTKLENKKVSKEGKQCKTSLKAVSEFICVSTEREVEDKNGDDNKRKILQKLSSNEK